MLFSNGSVDVEEASTNRSGGAIWRISDLELFNPTAEFSLKVSRQLTYRILTDRASGSRITQLAGMLLHEPFGSAFGIDCQNL